MVKRGMMGNEIISRAEARARGLKRYFTGKPCKWGHVCKRIALDAHCAKCKDERIKEWGNKNIKKVTAYRKQYLKDRRKEYTQYMRAWRVNNKEKDLQIQRKGREKNREKLREKDRIRSKERPDIVRIKNHNRRSLKLQATGRFTRQDVVDILRMQKGRCAICKIKIIGKYHADHIVPLSKSGDNSRRNIQITHPKCNLKKTNKHPIDFMRQEFGLLL